MSDKQGDTPRAHEREHGDTPQTPSDKRPYSPPTLVDYGSIGKLTQGASGAFAETGGMKLHHCL